MLWGDVLINHPDKIDELPKDAIFIDWGYNKDYPFMEHAKMLDSKKTNYLLAPGTSSWSTITSRILDMQETIINSANASKKYHGLGILVTDWGDIGHLQYLPVSYLGFILGGLVAWSDSSLNDAICYLKKMLNDDALVEAILELGKYHLLEGEYRSYGSRLFNTILWAEHAMRQDNPTTFYQEKMMANLIDEKHLALLKISFIKAESLLALAKDTLEKEEMLNSLFLLKTLASLNAKFSLLKIQTVDFNKEIQELKQYAKVHKTLWEKRNNPYGYEESVKRIKWLIEILLKLTRKEQIQ